MAAVIPVRMEGTIQRIGRRLMLERVMRGLTQQDVADDLGVAQGTISAVETGASRGKLCNPTIGTAALIATYFGLRLELMAPYHSPLLELSKDEVADVMDLVRSAAERSIRYRLILRKLEGTE
ncbi:MAG TPA: helix-turn-helix transcriptional regulator [Armatimonadota bacterium]|nr:helix-turn-helix transcriptional regulator [Armatimonadota bacterium]